MKIFLAPLIVFFTLQPGLSGSFRKPVPPTVRIRPLSLAAPQKSMQVLKPITQKPWLSIQSRFSRQSEHTCHAPRSRHRKDLAGFADWPFDAPRWLERHLGNLASSVPVTAISLALCLLMVASPVVEMLYMPTILERQHQAMAVETNRQVLEEVFGLVAGQHYGLDQHEWDFVFGQVEPQLERATASEEALGAALTRLVDALGDAYSKYSSPTQLRHQSDSAPFGLQLASPVSSSTRGTSAAVVKGVLPDSPAEMSGLRAGDVVSAAAPAFAPEQTDAAEQDTAQTLSADADDPASAASLLSVLQSAKDDVVLHVQRGEQSTQVTLHRLAAWSSRAPGRVLRLSDGAGGFVEYIRLRCFSEASTDMLSDELRRLERDGCTGLVIDLRNNPGGMIREAMHQATFFLAQPSAIITYTLDAAGFLTAHSAFSVTSALAPTSLAVVSDVAADGAQPDGDSRSAATATAAASDSHALSVNGLSSEMVALDSFRSHELSRLMLAKPLVVLVDRGTASSAELFAAALHDNGRALIMGEPTLGKGLIQRTFSLRNGGLLKLTIGEYLRPNKQRVVKGVGLEPDLSCVATPSADYVDACMQRAVRLVSRGSRRAPATSKAAMDVE